MGFRKDLTGQRFGKLIVTGFDNERTGYEYFWKCLCDCGNTKVVQRDNLIYGNTKTCGCGLHLGSPTHGMSQRKHIIYSKWTNMHQRCSNPNADSYALYGGRGIKVCERWNSFENFRDDMLPSWKDSLTLERIDSDKGYSPENCKWANETEQSRNRRSNHRLTYNNQTKCMIEWAEIFNIPYGTLWNRIVNLKWSVEKALNFPINSR